MGLDSARSSIMSLSWLMGRYRGKKSSSETAYRNRAPLGMALTGRLADLQTVHVFWRLRVSPCKQIQSLVTLPTAVSVAEQQDVG
jgi:hypothetical protein